MCGGHVLGGTGMWPKIIWKCGHVSKHNVVMVMNVVGYVDGGGSSKLMQANVCKRVASEHETVILK